VVFERCIFSSDGDCNGRDRIVIEAEARTVETYRKRGAQQALIAKRVERAEQIGCSILVSETLTMLEHSLRNLQRAGFQEVYEKEVYEWNA
jgi:GNAT superfamily N-acetyltransferase